MSPARGSGGIDSFYLRSPVEVAPELLGCRLSYAEVTIVVVETEAYLASDDEASHARSGPTQRCQSMFGPVGHLYVYRSYGVHYCLNVVCHLPETGGAVLLRAAEVVEGKEWARKRRGADTKGLANGPGKLAQCLGLTVDHDGLPLAASPQSGTISLQRIPPLKSSLISAGKRVGISRNQNKPYRFWVTDSAEVSRVVSR